MDERTTTVRMPEDLALTADLVARGRGTSVNALERVKTDLGLMEAPRTPTERDKEILDRLAE